MLRYQDPRQDRRLFLGERTYLEFRPFQEIFITQRGKFEEAEVPGFILNLAEGG